MRKKVPSKLRLSRDTLLLLDPKSVSLAVGGVITSCTYPCECPTGCTDDQPCLGTAAEA
jgi:hypothetical protein